MAVDKLIQLMDRDIENKRGTLTGLAPSPAFDENGDVLATLQPVTG